MMKIQAVFIIELLRLLGNQYACSELRKMCYLFLANVYTCHFACVCLYDTFVNFMEILYFQLILGKQTFCVRANFFRVSLEEPREYGFFVSRKDYKLYFYWL